MTSWPQYLIVVYWTLTLGIAFGCALADFKGPPLTAWFRFWARLIGTTTLAFWLWRGGFFSAIGWPP